MIDREALTPRLRPRVAANATSFLTPNATRSMRFVDGFDVDAFLANDKTFYAATRCLEFISEASRRLPPAFKERFPEIPWKQVAGFIDRAHAIDKVGLSCSVSEA